MAIFEKSMEELRALEFNHFSNVLHRNKGEKGLTYFGIYETAHPSWSGWKIVYKTLKKCNYFMKEASRQLYNNKMLTRVVYSFYERKYWDIMRLDNIEHQKIADELFVFGVNTNPKKAIKKAQKIVGVKVDGWIGAKTIKALNSYDPKKFDLKFDMAEIAFYRYLAFAHPRKSHYRRFYNGWVNRARAV